MGVPTWYFPFTCRPLNTPLSSPPPLLFTGNCVSPVRFDEQPVSRCFNCLNNGSMCGAHSYLCLRMNPCHHQCAVAQRAQANYAATYEGGDAVGTPAWKFGEMIEKPEMVLHKAVKMVGPLLPFLLLLSLPCAGNGAAQGTAQGYRTTLRAVETAQRLYNHTCCPMHGGHATIAHYSTVNHAVNRLTDLSARFLHGVTLPLTGLD